jgi:hypothetical protein
LNLFEPSAVLCFPSTILFSSLKMSQTSHINFLTRWKIQLTSSDRKLRLVALTEVVEFLNRVDEEKIYEISVILINNELSHFLSEAMSYSNKGLMSLINKIVCQLSETQEFFTRDFFKVFRGYLRVVAMFPSVCDDSSKHQQDIFSCMNIFLKR